MRSRIGLLEVGTPLYAERVVGGNYELYVPSGKLVNRVSRRKLNRYCEALEAGRHE